MNQGQFETKIYDMLSCLPLPHPGKEECPAVLAERKGKSPDETMQICRKCFLELMKRDKGPQI